MSTKSICSGISTNILACGFAFSMALGANSAMAAINASTSGPAISNPTNTEDFESIVNLGVPYVALSGFTFDCATCSFVGSNYGGSETLYQNGGSTSMTTVSLTSGNDISAISMENYNGFSDTISQIWVRAYNNGSAVASFPLADVPIGSTITVWADNSSIFDEVRIQAYRETDPINEDEAQYGAIAIDNVIAGSAVRADRATPVPTMSIWSLGILISLLGVIGIRRRRMI